MKSDFGLQTSDITDTRLVTIIFGFWLIAITAGAVTSNPYEAIVGRNVFGLKPPTPTAPAPPPPAASAAISFKLLGISTILDRRQVLLKVKIAGRPPEPPKEKSYLWSEGQGEDDIEVLEIDAVAGMVKIKNHETTMSLTMKDDAEKPAVGAALPGPAAPPPVSPQFPGLPSPTNPGQPAPPGAGASVTAIGGSGSPRTLPTRTLRGTSGSNPGGPSSGNGYGVGALGSGTTAGAATGSSLPTTPPSNNLSPEAQAILIEAQRGQLAPGGFDPLPKTGLTPR